MNFTGAAYAWHIYNYKREISRSSLQVSNCRLSSPAFTTRVQRYTSFCNQYSRLWNTHSWFFANSYIFPRFTSNMTTHFHLQHLVLPSTTNTKYRLRCKLLLPLLLQTAGTDLLNCIQTSASNYVQINSHAFAANTCSRGLQKLTFPANSKAQTVCKLQFDFFICKVSKIVTKLQTNCAVRLNYDQSHRSQF